MRLYLPTTTTPSIPGSYLVPAHGYRLILDISLKGSWSLICSSVLNKTFLSGLLVIPHPRHKSISLKKWAIAVSDAWDLTSQCQKKYVFLRHKLSTRQSQLKRRHEKFLNWEAKNKEEEEEKEQERKKGKERKREIQSQWKKLDRILVFGELWPGSWEDLWKNLEAIE